MATTFRRRHNLLSNTLGAALATGATSITFGSALQEGGSNIATLGTDEYLPLTIESEIVYLTAYTAGATTGTVARAKESTVDPGVDHPNGAAVKNTPTKVDIKDASAWTALSLSNSWVANSASTIPAYRMLPNGLVVLKGLVKNGTSAGAVIATLPAGFRPGLDGEANLMFVTVSNSVFAVVTVASNGQIYLAVGGSTAAWTSLDPIRFFADQ